MKAGDKMNNDYRKPISGRGSKRDSNLKNGAAVAR
jgi:hypothetical protein